MSSAEAGAAPSQVPPELVVAFDLYGLNNDARLDRDVQQGLTCLHKNAPDVFFAPANRCALARSPGL